jgi:hypothetical protein
VTLIAALGCLVAAAPASAFNGLESVFQDDDLLIHSPPEAVDRHMAELKRLGVDRIRVSAIWRDMAPLREPADATDPDAYPLERIGDIDRTIQLAYRNGLMVLFNIRGGAPDWAMPRRPANLADEDAYKPNIRKWNEFVQAMGVRYSGNYVTPNGTTLPRVNTWSIWNEPNWPSLLQPQSRRGEPYSPHLYRRLFRAASRGLRGTGHGSDIILLGETAPLGVDEPGPTRSVKAALFYRELFCLEENLKPKPNCGDYGKRGPLLADGIAHHPYPVLAPPEYKSPDKGYIRLGDRGRFVRILDAAERYGRLPGRLPIWYTEFGYQTRPPDPYRGIPLKRQAAWNVRAERLAYKQDRVVALTQFLLNDSPPRTQYPPRHKNYWSNYQTGLRYFDGRRKPAYFAYRLPFLRLSSRRFWGQVRPADNGTVQEITIQHRRPGGTWEPVGTRQVTNARGFFEFGLAFPQAGEYRFVWKGMASPSAVRAAPKR